MKGFKPFLLATAVILGLLPVFSIILWTSIARWPLADVMPASFSLGAWRLLRAGDLAGLALAALRSALTALVSCVMAVACSRFLTCCGGGAAAFFEGLFFFPALLPSFCVILAFHQASLRVLPSFMMVPMVWLYLFFSFPYAFRVIYSAYKSQLRAFRETAATLGAGPLESLGRVELPMLSSHLGAAFVFAYAVAYGQYLIEAFFYSGRKSAFSITMAEYLQSANRSAAAVYTLLYTLAGLAALLVPRLLPVLMNNRARSSP